MQNISNESDLILDDSVTVIKFWAAWCKPCLQMNKLMEKLEKEFSDVKFFSVDIDQVPAIAQKYKIRSLPTVLFLKNSKEQSRVSGLALIDPLRKSIKDLIGTD